MPTRWFRWLVSMMGIVLVAGFAAGPAHARDPLDRFYQQRPDWQPCHDGTLDAAGASCAGVLVPLNYSHPDGRTLTIAISRIAATDPARRRGVLLSNPGGPGGAGLQTMVTVQKGMTPDVRAQYDLIGMDPRGIGRSDAVHCAIPLPTMLFSSGFDVFGYARDTGLAAVLAASCLAGDIDKLRNITTRNTARDMDVIRAALGVEQISYYGASYGTYLGAVYTQMFPSRTDRMVLDSAVDPDRYWVGMYQDMGPINEYALDDWAAWAARHDDQYHFGATPQQVRAFVEDMIRRAAAHPVISLGSGYLVDEHTVPIMLLALLSNPKMNAGLADVVRLLSDGVDGKPLDVSKLKSKISGAAPEAAGMAAVTCGDRAAPRNPAWYYRNIEAARPTQPVFGAFANNITVCAYWPDPLEPATQVHNATPALILAVVHDTRTAYPEGVALHRDLSASRLVTLADTRIHGSFRPGLSPCVNDSVNTYLATGALPATDVTCEPDPEFFPK
ncbi:alpha/beta fold hydrolase [Nocardia jiangxiensis]|uniref:Alpha/beta fold hydrolase n=1 Tax=Nocardia jiangxiensis TaxID=282685 RepID=A0ABW6RZU4_9NOCA|nr:alpha/beta fold hydrolase [Nocardia jiangxiensis]